MRKGKAAIMLALLLLAAACGGKPARTAATRSPSPTESPTESTRAPNSVEVQDTSRGGIFFPRALTVPAGTTVSWTQTGRNAHTVQSPKKLFNSHPACQIHGAGPQYLESVGCMKKGDTFTLTFKTPGIYFYFCLPHGAAGETPDAPTHGMAGTITVM